MNTTIKVTHSRVKYHVNSLPLPPQTHEESLDQLEHDIGHQKSELVSARGKGRGWAGERTV